MTNYDKVKLNVTSILNVASKFVTADELGKLYRQILGSDIPFKELGFESVTSLLRSYSSKDIMLKNFGNVMHCKAVEQECLKHVTDLIKKTKSVLPKVNVDKHLSNKARAHNNDKYLMPPNIKERIANLMMSYPSGIKLKSFTEAYARMFGHYLNFSEGSFKNIEDLLRWMHDVVSIESRDNDLIVIKNFTDKVRKILPGMPLPCNTGIQNYNKPKEFKKRTIDIPSDLRDDIYQVLKRHPNGIFSYHFQKTFEKDIKATFPMQWSPHGELLKMMLSLPEVTCIEHMCHLWFFHSSCFNGSSAHLDKRQAKDAYQVLVRDFFYDVLFTNPSGITKEDLIAQYQKTFTEDINLAALHLNGISDLISSMTDFVTTEYMGAGKAFLKLKSHLDRTSNILFDTNYILEDIAMNTSYTHEILKLPETHPIIICELENSGIFYFQFHKDRRDIDILMEDLRHFYTSHIAELYKVPETYLEVGLLCAAQFGNTWHRCIVENVFYDEIKVLYVDYGTRQTVDKHELRFLRNEFSIPKAFCCQGRLKGVQPNTSNGLLTKESCEYFFEYVNEKVLNSLLFAYDDDGSILLNLHHHHHDYMLPDDDDYDYDNDLMFFNNVMILNGHARYVTEPTMNKRITGSRLDSKNYQLDDDNDDTGIDKNQHDDDQLHSSHGPIKLQEVVVVVPAKNMTKCIRLTGEYDITLINLNDKPYLASCDFSSFFWEYDIVCTVISDLLSDKEGLLKICSDDHLEIFKRLMKDIPRLEDNERTCITLFGLDFVVEFLESFPHSDEKLILAIQNELDLFNPQDCDWTGDQGMNTLDSFSEESRQSPDKMILSDKWDDDKIECDD